MAVEAEAEGFHFVSRWLADVDASDAPFETPTTRFLGVEAEGRLVAFGGVTPDPYVNDGRVGRLRHVYVNAGARGQGIGAALVRALEGWAHDVYVTLRLRTDSDAASRFYERLGYVLVVDRHATHSRSLRASVDEKGAHDPRPAGIDDPEVTRLNESVVDDWAMPPDQEARYGLYIILGLLIGVCSPSALAIVVVIAVIAISVATLRARRRVRALGLRGFCRDAIGVVLGLLVFSAVGWIARWYVGAAWRSIVTATH